MTTLAPTFLGSHQCIGFGRGALSQLRTALERGVGAQAATYLQEAGFAAGEELHGALHDWMHETYGVGSPAELDASFLGEALSAFFASMGWGTLTVHTLTEGVLALDSADWAEASTEQSALAPSCHVSCGMLADMLGRIASQVVAVMEVECRSRGDARCRFVAGSPETLGLLYEKLAAGETYQVALGVTV